MSALSMAEQVTICQTPRLGYMQGHADADRRMAEGQEQTYCKTCGRWQWPEFICPLWQRDTDVEAYYQNQREEQEPAP